MILASFVMAQIGQNAKQFAFNFAFAPERIETAHGNQILWTNNQNALGQNASSKTFVAFGHLNDNWK